MWQVSIGRWIVDHGAVEHNAASGLIKPENLFRLLDTYNIEATLMPTQSAAIALHDAEHVAALIANCCRGA